MRYKLTIAYDGTDYSGWQVQTNGQAIQPLVQKALETFLRGPIQLTGSSRTDAGVHAKGQVAHFDTEVPFEKRRILLSLNALLPSDIRIMDIEEMDAAFHARYSAKSKVYHYHLQIGSPIDPFSRHYSHQVFGPFDLTLLKEGVKEFLGTHDFTAFANSGNEKEGTRTLIRIDPVEQKGGLRLEFEGNGFLYKMVRNITGTLLEIASGKRARTDIPHILASRNRRLSGPTAPAKGLCLIQIHYK